MPKTGPNTKPGEKPPIMPLEATQHTPDGAKAFAEFFIKTIDWGYATTSSAYMRHYFRKSCVQCRNVQLFLNNAYRKGDHYVGGRITIVDATVSRPSTTGASYEIGVHVDITSSEVVDKDGHTKSQDVAYHHLGQIVSVSWRSNRWAVVDLGTQR